MKHKQLLTYEPNPTLSYSSCMIDVLVVNKPHPSLFLLPLSPLPLPPPTSPPQISKGDLAQLGLD